MNLQIFFLVVISFSLFIVDAENRCGTDWSSANSQCVGRGCTSDGDCPSSDQYCFADTDDSACSDTSIDTSSDSSTTRCGSDWSTANSGCGSSCTTDDDCSSGEYCFTDLAACSTGSSSDSSDTSSSSGTSTTAECSTTHTVTNSDLQQIMENPTKDFTEFLEPLNSALSRYGMNCPQRIAVFLAQVRHETAGLTVFHQPIDNGGGTLHMTPSNWGYACAAVPEIAEAFGNYVSGCGDCSCVSGFSTNPLSSDTTAAAETIFSQPLVAFMSGAWWFAAGASTPEIFGWKGCGDLRLDSDVGIGSAGSSDCTHTGYYQVTCCIFWTIGGSAGVDQRISYYETALSIAKGWSTSSAEEDSDSEYHLGDNKKVIILSAVCGVFGLVIIVLLAKVLTMHRRYSRVLKV